MSANQPVNIKVLSIGRSSRAGFADIVIQFNNSPERNYPYRRKAGADSNGNKFVIISGCRITFDDLRSDSRVIVISQATNGYSVSP